MKSFILTILSGLIISFFNYNYCQPNKIPIVYCDYILIPSISENIEGNYLFDTGTENLHFDSIYYYKNNFSHKDSEKIKIYGIGNSFQEGIIIKDKVEFKINDNQYSTSYVLVHDLKSIGGDLVDGLVGLGFFSNNVLELNFIEQYMCFYDSVSSLDLSEYSSVPLKKYKGSIFVPLNVFVNKDVSFQGIFMLDLGSPLSTLTTSTSNELQLNKNIKTKIEYYTKYGGIGGYSYGYGFICDSIQIDDFILKNVNLSYSVDTSGIMSSIDFNGILGNDILDKYDIIIDFPNSNLYLKPNENYETPYIFDNLGFSFVNRSKTMGGWIVTGLNKKCPAEKQGIRIDDKIISVNDIPVNQISCESYSTFFKEIDEAEFTILRDNNKLKAKFRLEPLLK